MSEYVMVKPRVAADLTGMVVGRLTAIRKVPAKPRALWLCKCTCGGEKLVLASNYLKRAHNDCGCGFVASRQTSALAHGDNRAGRRTKEYRTWAKIKGRCHNPTDAGYADYGGRGITMCDAWRESFEAFLRDVGRAPSPKDSIDRIDNDQGYTPDNVRWATPSQQVRNRRSTIRHNGEAIADICDRTGLPLNLVHARLKRGDAMEDALLPVTGQEFRQAKRSKL